MSFSDAELLAFLDEALPADRSSELEAALREDESLRERLVQARGRETAGLHSVGAIWRRNRLSCPIRAELGQVLLGALSEAEESYLQFHLETVGCRYCQANLADLRQEAQQEQAGAERQRRQHYFQTSAGYLKR